MNTKKQLLMVGLALAALLPLVALFLLPAASLASTASHVVMWMLGAGLAVGTAFQVRDKSLTVSKALSNGAGAVYTDGIDLGHGTHPQVMLPNFEIEIDAPALTTTLLPNSETMTYDIQHDDDPAFGTVATLLTAVVVQTGAGGVGAAAIEATKARLPSSVKRYIRMKVTKTGTGNASTVSGTMRLVF